MPPPKRPSWSLVAVAGLVVLNVALVAALAYRQSTLNSPATTAVPGATASTPASDTATRSVSPTPDPPSSGTPSASPKPTDTSSSDDVIDSRRVMAVSTSSVAWRAERGTCGQDTKVEVSTDSGRNWRATEPGLGAIVRLKTFGDQSVFAIGADDECRASFATIESPTATWAIDRSMTADIWYRVPGNEDDVHAPGGDTSRPCGDDLVGLAGRGTYEAVAMCADGRLRAIREGQKWTTLRSDTGAVAVNADDSRFTVARRMDGCSGLVIQHFGATGRGLSNTADDCWDIAWESSDPVAVGSRGDVTWLWSGDVVRLS